MKKAVIILSILALIAGSCGQATKKQAETVNNENISATSNDIKNAEKVPFDYKALPAEWVVLTSTGEDGKYVISEGETLTIEGNELVYWSNRYDILKSYQIGDTIVINTMSKMPIQLSISSEEQEWNFKIFWFDKDKGLAQWTINDENLGDSGLFVIKEKMSEYPVVVPTFAD